MLGDFLWWVAEKKLAQLCLSVCLCIQAFWHLEHERDGPIGTGEASFYAPERRKGDGANRGAIGATCQCANPCKKYFDEAAGQTSGRTRLNPCGPMATIGGQNPVGKTMVVPPWHVPQVRAK